MKTSIPKLTKRRRDEEHKLTRQNDTIAINDIQINHCNWGTTLEERSAKNYKVCGWSLRIALLGRNHTHYPSGHITLNQRWIDVVSTLYASWDSDAAPCYKNSTRSAYGILYFIIESSKWKTCNHNHYDLFKTLRRWFWLSVFIVLLCRLLLWSYFCSILTIALFLGLLYFM